MPSVCSCARLPGHPLCRPAGRIHVRTGLDGNSALAGVTDTGVGIAPADLPRIFERFYRADQARGRAEGRSGLGLAIAKSIVDAHGGLLEAASEPGQGTTLTVRLPAHPTHPAPPPAPARPTPDPGPA